MRKMRRHLPVLVSAMLMVLLLPSTAAAQGAFGTDPQIAEGAGPPEPITVTDVDVASLDGFDRVTFHIAGDGLAGWRVNYEDDPRTEGRGDPVELAGDATLRVAITNAAFPPEAPDETFEDDVAGPEGGVVTEVFNDKVFEGQHVFFIGVTAELPFRVQRLEGPQRVVVDIASTPVGGVDTGRGGAADSPTPFTALAAILAVAGAVAVARANPWRG